MCLCEILSIIEHHVGKSELREMRQVLFQIINANKGCFVVLMMPFCLIRMKMRTFTWMTQTVTVFPSECFNSHVFGSSS